MSASKIRLAEQVLESHKRRLRTATDKDGVRRQIAAMQRVLDALRAGESCDVRKMPTA
jgi:hypothetical protein